MGLYRIEEGKSIAYPQTEINAEKEIEVFLEKHPEVLDSDIFIIGRQVPTSSNGIIDLMGMDQDGNAVIIEIKKDQPPRDTISQILEYAVWAEQIQYDDLNKIAKKHGFMNDHDTLFDKFKKDFELPDRFNDNQRLYIVSPNVDRRLTDVARYLWNRGIKIKCAEISFFDNKQLVDVKYLLGDEKDSDDLGHKSASDRITWDDLIKKATPENKNNIFKLIDEIKEKYDCTAAPQNRYYYFRIKGKDRKNHFATIIAQVKEGLFYFKHDPKTFDIKNDALSPVRESWWFFENERRVHINSANHDLIFKCLDHAYNLVKKS